VRQTSVFKELRLLLLARRGPFALLLLPVAAILVRLPGTWQDLPFVFHWDEPTLVNLATWLFTEGSLNPRFFNYPGGMIYLLGLLYLLTLLGGILCGALPGWAAGMKVLAAGTYPRPPGGGIIYRFPTRGAPVAYLVGRFFSVLLGALTVWWVARLAERLAGRRAAWLAGGLLALNSLHAANSVLVTTDVACGAFLAWFLLGLADGRSPRTAGIALGLAAACKYTGGIGIYLWPLGLLLTPVIGRPGSGIADAAANAGEELRLRRAAWNRFWLRLLPWAGGTFLLLNPFAVLSPGAFLRGFLYEARHMRAGTEHFGAGIGLGPTGPSVVAVTMWRELGPIVLIAILLALLLAVPARRRAKVVEPSGKSGSQQLDHRWIFLLAAWCGVCLLQLCTWKTAYPRYLLPLWPALAVLAGCGASMTAEEVLREQGATRVRSARRVAMIAAAALLVGPGLYPLGRSVAVRLRTDPRLPMSAFLAATVRPGEGIGMETGGPWISSEWNQVIRVDLLGRSGPDGWRRQGVRYLLATGREAHLPGGSPDSLQTNRQRIEQEALLLWRSGPYAVYDLGNGQGSAEGVRALVAAGQMQEAERRARALWAADPTSVAAAMLVGDVLVARQDTSGAVDAYGRAAGLAPRDASPLLALGNIALSGCAWDAAVEAFSLAVDRSPRDPLALHNLATALLYRAREAAASGNRPAASADLRAAVRFGRAAVSFDPEDGRFRETEARAREMAGRFGVSLDH
jgi:hypothetical protein